MDFIASGRYQPTPERYGESYIEMPVGMLAVSAGTGEFLDEGGFEMIRFPKSAVPGGADFGVRVNGDSMEPVCHDGQIVWVKNGCSAAWRGRRVPLQWGRGSKGL